MGTTRLSFATNPHPIKLNQTGRQEIEVPAGESHFRISQQGGSADPEDDRELTFHLRHPGSLLRVSGIVEAAGEWTPRLRIRLLHHAPETRAETLVRTLSRDKAHPSFEGLIEIMPGADGVESYLNHHSLLLGTRAKSRTVPSLEIKADQVKCSHAATIRTITEEDLFYPRSRGFGLQEAEALLIEAFVADVS
jgi:Fe-S cluster assembly protein SufD